MNIAPAHPATRDIATDNDVGTLVRGFYRRAIPDPRLGPVYERFGVDWPQHLPKLVAYWQHVLLDRPGIRTNTIGVHGGVQRVAPFGPEHIDRWVELWEETVDDLFVGAVAELAKTRARQVGRALEAVARRRDQGANR
jgi:hemoglobin